MRHLNFTKGIALMALMSAICLGAAAQQAVGDKTIQLAANSEYDKAGKVKRIIWGDHYRKEWGAMVTMPVLDMNVAGGGLTPIKKGGGMQTTSLRLKGADGKEYVLRSVIKDPSAVLPEELKGTFADDILQDQMSSSNPYAPLAVAALAEAAGVFHTEPQIVYVAPSERLGEFEKEFAGTVCLFEERPADNKNGNAAFGNSKDISSTEKMLENVFTNSDHKVDERAFLKARLLDMLIGDWDRHEGQWLWASFKENGKTIYKPIPRDRDQAFASMDGIVPTIGTRTWTIRHIKNFDDKVKDVNGLNQSGNALDRNFTISLVKNDWIRLIMEMQQQLTDEVIESAIKKMPAEIVRISGKEIITKLKNRRNNLEKYALDYYSFLTNTVSITGTNQQETFEVKRLNNESTVVTVYQSSNVIYKRIFLHKETKEIRLYGLGGNDAFNVDAKAKKHILVREIAEKEQYNRKASFYDRLTLKQFPGYNPDDGVYIGGGITFKKQQFGKEPYGYMQSVWANYAFATGAYNFGYKGIFKDVVNKWDLHLDATINAPNYVRNYYGLGNETVKIVDDNKYHRLRSDQFIFSAGMYKQISSKSTIGAGIGYDQIKVKRTEDRFVTSKYSKLDSSDFGRKKYTSLFVDYEFNTLDNLLFPRSGVRISTDARYVRNLEGSSDFVKLSFESSFFVSSGRWTLALRSGGSTNLDNEYEFFQANTLGGMSNLRGYRRDRFAGKSSVFNNTEVRFKVSSFKGYVLGGQYGLLAFVDNGRVWMPDEKSNEWHYGYGGGVWVLIYKRLPLTATYGVSKEDRLINIKAGFLF